MDTEVDYYYNGVNEVKWWEEFEESEKEEENYYWEPPKTVDLLYNVHMNRTTHIKSPFHHRRYPYEYKNKEYYKYKSDKVNKQQEGVKMVDKSTKVQKPVMNMELNKVKKKETTYRDMFKEKSLRQRIYDGEVFFYEDYLEYNIAKDYCRLFRRPFNIPRQDWGGENYYFGEKIPNEELKVDNNEIKKLESIKYKEKLDKESNKKQSETDKLIISSNYLDDFKKNELLKGEIPSMFENNTSIIKQKPRKDRWVSYHNLKNYGLMIDSVTKCPLIHVQLQTALQLGWNPHIKGTVLQQSEVITQKEIKDPYEVTKEQIEEANKILSERRKIVEEPLPDITKLFKSKSYGINENCYTIGGGRYTI